ncbi:MAG TPA: GDYXXLXY domain-containing protein [Allocoleopsis sp.]
MNQPTPQPIDLPALQPAQPAVQSWKPIKAWRLWVPLLFQAALIVAVPARDAYTAVTGKTITLQTAPVDPYDLMRGYYQTLSYDISNPTLLRSLPGGEQLSSLQGQSTDFYVVMQAPASVPSNSVPSNSVPSNSASSTPAPSTPASSPSAPSASPLPWKPVRVSLDRPTDLTANQVAIQGHYNGWQVLYGLETYYMPEDQRSQVNADISQTQTQNRQAFVVEAKVDQGGNAIPVSLWVRDRNYQF